MKTCPSCKTEYTDDSLFYCLQDGTPLGPADTGEEPTIVRSEFPVAPTNVSVPARRGPGTASVVAATVAGMLLIIGVLGLGAFLYFRKGAGDTPRVNVTVPANSTKPSSSPGNSTPRPEPTTPANVKANSAPPERAPDEAAVVEEVTQRVRDWVGQTEDLDIDSYMSNYGPRVDYYQKNATSRASVMADKERAFANYDSVRIDISNEDYSVDPSGKTATATFDKEWDFQGESRSRGKVRQLLRFELIGGRWLITAEKDLKLYYKN